MVGAGVPGGDLVLPGEAAGEETGDGAQLSWRRCPNYSLQRHQEQRRQYSRSSSRQGSQGYRHDNLYIFVLAEEEWCHRHQESVRQSDRLPDGVFPAELPAGQVQ